MGDRIRPDSHKVVATSSEGIMTGPGRLNVTADFVESPVGLKPDSGALRFRCVPAGHDRAITLDLELDFAGEETDTLRWEWNRQNRE